MNKNNVIKFIAIAGVLSVILITVTLSCLVGFGVIEISRGEEHIQQEHIDEELLGRAEENKGKSKEKKKPDKADEQDEKLDAAEIKDEEKPEAMTAVKTSKGVIVLDPGHGVSSGTLSDEQKKANGWVYSSAKGGWGEWRHFKSGTMWQDCEGSGCTGRAPKNGSCWYPISSGDRSTEPELNLNNALAAKKYLEEMGYEVRVTRGADSHPSMTKRLEYCYPNGDKSQSPDADVFVCLHSNAGGGRGSYYIALSGLYDQAGIGADYIEQGNALGQCINDRIVSSTGLSAAAGGRYNGYPELVLFCKSPIPIAYMEIGFFDNSSDLSILKSNSDAIGKAIADGVNDYMSQ